MPTDATSYRWSERPVDKPIESAERRRIIGDKVMVSHITLRPGAHVPTHAHENEQISAVLSGRLRFGIGAEGSAARRDVVVGAGEVIHLPSGVPHSADALEETVVLDVFSPPSATTGIDLERR